VVEDTVIHEMGHAWLYLTGQETAHDSDAWYAMVRRLSPAVLGHELDARRGAARKSVRVPNPRFGEDGQPKTVVRKVPVNDAIAHADVARWPVRPEAFDPGQPIDCPTY
jgi:hypothetical protein